MVRTHGRLAFAPGGATLAGSIRDKADGERIPAKVSVTTSAGGFVHPDGAILKVGTGDPFFYADGGFEVNVPRGATRVVVERGTEYAPAVLDVEMPASRRRHGRRGARALVGVGATRGGIPATRTSTTTTKKSARTSVCGWTRESRTSG